MRVEKVVIMSALEKNTILDPTNKREQVRDQIEETRRNFHSLLEKLTNDQLDKPSLNPAWTIREVLYHMSFAPRNLPLDVWMIKHLNWVPKVPAGPFNRLNTYLTRRGGRDLGKLEIAKAYDEGHQRTIKALESVNDDEWQKGVNYPDWDPMLSGFVTFERLFGYITLHFNTHAQEIEAALKSTEIPL
jgi:hypothetical protein